MNLIKYNPIFFIALLLFVACEPAIDDKSDIGLPATPSFTIDRGETPNDLILTSTTEGGFIFQWKVVDLDGMVWDKGTGSPIELIAPYAETYNIELTAFSRGGSATHAESITLTTNHPDPCILDFKILTGCGEKTWRLLQEEGALKVAASAVNIELDDLFWFNKTDDVTIRNCHFDDLYTFRDSEPTLNEGQFKFDNQDSFWADSQAGYLGLPLEVCYTSSDWPEAYNAWDSGVHSFSISKDTTTNENGDIVINDALTLVGYGAWIGLYTLGTNSEINTPQDSVKFIIKSIDEERLVLLADYSSLAWQIILEPVEAE